MEALEAHVLPSSRLANEAAGTTIRFIQSSPHLLAPRAVNFAASVSASGCGRRCQSCLHLYTFRSMPRRYASQATTTPPEASRPSRRQGPSGAQAWATRLIKRVVQKPDGRYLVYYDKA